MVSECRFKEPTLGWNSSKTKGDALENKIYKSILDELSIKEAQEESKNFQNQKFIEGKYRLRQWLIFIKNQICLAAPEPTNNKSGKTCFCGSEGSLAFTTGSYTKVDVIFSRQIVLLCGALSSIQESLEICCCGNETSSFVQCMRKSIDDNIRNVQKTNRNAAKNRVLLVGEPKVLQDVWITLTVCGRCRKTSRRFDCRFRKK